jgi:hypothetical protein
MAKRHRTTGHGGDRGRPDVGDHRPMLAGSGKPAGPSTDLAHLEPNLPPAATAQALAVLGREVCILSRRLEDVLTRDRPARAAEDRKEMWVLLSALTVVVVFCFVAFYLNGVEVRDLHSGLQAEINQAGQTTAASLERAIGRIRFDKVIESQAVLDRYLKEKDRRDSQRFSEILEEMGRRSERDQGRLQEELRSLQAALERLKVGSMDTAVAGGSTPAHPAAPAAGGVGGGPAAEIAFQVTSPATGRAARASDGVPENGPPDPAARPPGPEIQAGGAGSGSP